MRASSLVTSMPSTVRGAGAAAAIAIRAYKDSAGPLTARGASLASNHQGYRAVTDHRKMSYMDTSRTVLLAQHVMQRAVFVLHLDRQVLDAVDDLIQRGFSGAPVIDRDRLVGVFSERDALTSIAAAHYEQEPPGTVAQHMRRDFAVVAPDADIFEVASVFRDQPIRRVPVVDTERRLLGIISRGDLLNALRQTFRRRQPTQYEQLQEHMAQRHTS